MCVSRICVCGKKHDTVIENMESGAFKQIDKCIDCLLYTESNMKDFKEAYSTPEIDDELTRIRLEISKYQ